MRHIQRYLTKPVVRGCAVVLHRFDEHVFVVAQDVQVKDMMTIDSAEEYLSFAYKALLFRVYFRTAIVIFVESEIAPHVFIQANMLTC